MSKLYIEDEGFVSCTFDLAGTPRNLGRTKERRVGYSPETKNKELLTEEDRYITAKFECKLVAKQWGGLAALIGGIVVGVIGAVIVGVAVILSGPVGWIIAGTLAAAAVVGTVSGYVAAEIALANHECTEPLKSGKWENQSDTVYINNEAALLYNHSTLICGNSGILLASETEEKAAELSEAMDHWAKWELAVQILSSSLTGGITGLGVIDVDESGIDLDLATIPLAIASYVENDFCHPERTPEQATLHGLKYTAIGYGLGYVKYIPGAPPIFDHLGTEFSKSDLITTALSTALSYGADKLEEFLNNHNPDVIEESKLSLTNIEDFPNSIIANDI